MPLNRVDGRPVGGARKETKKEEVKGKMSTGTVVQMCLLLGFGTLLILSGASIAALWHNIYSSLINKEFTLTASSKSFDMWKETPFPFYMEFYLFNWTNPRETLLHSAKPHFVQMGPYVFREHHSKLDLQWNDNSTITFKNMRQWHFEPKKSNGSLSDGVTNLNVIGMTLATLIEKHVSKKVLPIIYQFISKDEPIYITKTVEELLFQGYDDPFLTLAQKLKKYFPQINIPFKKFGWFYGRNMSTDYDGIFNMHTGADDITKLGLLTRWNYQDQVGYYKSPCGKVSGSTGELWPIDIAKKDTATVFANDICSALNLTRRGEVKGESGLKGMEFVGTRSTFSNDTCWCVSGGCQPYGVRDISTCRTGAPAFISFPHFYLADPIHNKRVSGLSPNASLHEFTITLDQDTGVPLDVNAKLQVNILAQPVTLLSLINQSLPEAMFPMLWFHQKATVQGDAHDQLVLLHGLGSSGQPLFFSVMALGVILSCLGVYLSYFGSWRRPNTHQLLTSEESSQSSITDTS